MLAVYGVTLAAVQILQALAGSLDNGFHTSLYSRNF